MGNPSENFMSQPRFLALTLGIMTSSYFFAMVVSDLSVVLGLVGATGSTTICYILPGAFYYKLCENNRIPGSRMSTIQILSGIMVLVGFFIMFTSLGNIMFGSAVGH